MVRGQPQKALGAQNLGKAFVGQRLQAAGMEGPAGAIDKAGDAVLFALGHVLVVEFADPAGGGLRLLHVEQGRC